MLKLIGVFLIIGSSAVLGLYYTKKDAYRIEDIGNIIRALSLLKSEISFLAMPLGEALIEAGNRSSGCVGELFCYAGELFLKNNGEDSETIWENAMDKRAGKTFLKAEDTDILRALGKALGFMDASAERAAIDIAISSLSENAHEAALRRRQTERMFFSISLLGGVLVCVILA